MKQKKSLIEWLGLLGVVSLLSYTAAVLFSPLAYPGYDWLAQAVSDLSASAAPSRMLWAQLSALYGCCNIVCVTMVCVFVQGKLTKLLRVGIYLFAAMSWIGVGYDMFPLSEGGMLGGSFQDVMHIVVTLLVMLVLIAGLILIIIGGCREKKWRSLAVWAALTLFLMMLGGIGSGVFPGIFGVFERFSVFSATAFTTVLGVYLFRGFKPHEGMPE